MATYTFGNYQINNFANGLGNVLLAKNLDMPSVKPQSFVVARRDGPKKSGEVVGQRDIQLDIQVVGASRSDLISRIDALQQNLSLRGQTLCIHEDGRFYKNVDCVDAVAKLEGGTNVVTAKVSAKFICYDPYAYAATSSSYDTGTVTLTYTSGFNYVFPAINLTGGGNIYTYPAFHITNKTSTGSGTLSAGLTNGSNYTSVSVNSIGYSGFAYDNLDIFHGGNTQAVTASANWSVGATSIPVFSFTANANYSSGDTITKATNWNNIIISQTQDGQTLTIGNSTAAPLPINNGDYVDILCDPSQTGGWSAQTNSSGAYSDPNGVFPVIEPGATTFNISILCASVVLADCLISWPARYLS